MIGITRTITLVCFACSSIIPFARPGGLLFRFDSKPDSDIHPGSDQGVAWEVEHFDKRGMFMQKVIKQFTVVNPQMILNQEYFPFIATYDTLHKLNLFLNSHCVLAEHEMNLALVRDCVYHADFFQHRIHFLTRCFSLEGITSALRFLVSNSSFISPENICVFRFCLFPDVREFISQPVLNSSVVPMIRSFFRFLRGAPGVSNIRHPYGSACRFQTMI